MKNFSAEHRLHLLVLLLLTSAEARMDYSVISKSACHVVLEITVACYWHSVGSEKDRFVSPM